MTKVENLFVGEEIRTEEKGFLEDLLEVIHLVSFIEDVGTEREYCDENGCVLFCTEIIGNGDVCFRFYDKEYYIKESIMEKLESILKG